MRSALALTLALLLASAHAPAQTPAPAAQQPQPSQTPAPEADSDEDDVVRITTNLVQFDAVVTDKQGRYVADLRPEEFEVYLDEGQPRHRHPVARHRDRQVRRSLQESTGDLRPRRPRK